MNAIKVVQARFGLAVRIEQHNQEEYFVSIANENQKHFKMYLIDQQVFVFNEKTKKTFVIPVTNVRELQIDANSIPGEYIDSFVKVAKNVESNISKSGSKGANPKKD